MLTVFSLSMVMELEMMFSRAAWLATLVFASKEICMLNSNVAFSSSLLIFFEGFVFPMLEFVLPLLCSG